MYSHISVTPSENGHPNKLYNVLYSTVHRGLLKHVCKEFRLQPLLLTFITTVVDYRAGAGVRDGARAGAASWLAGAGSYKKISFNHRLYRQVNRDFPFSSALPRKIFPGFPGKFFLFIYLSSFHVCRQCSPVQIKFVSFAEEINIWYCLFSPYFKCRL